VGFICLAGSVFKTLTLISIRKPNTMKSFTAYALLLAIAAASASATTLPAGENVAKEVTPAPANENSGKEVNACYWDGTAPFCAGSCSPGYTQQGTSTCGDGACCWTGNKAYCCQ
jgi:hypothetical protein